MSRIAVVEREKCNPIGCGGYLCMRKCPVNRQEQNCIFKDREKVGIDEVLCIGCQICARICPYEALSIINLPAELAKPPIHQFGRNGFHLYNLPVPLFGRVVGILGRNGIGKSTAIKILAGILKPNLGGDKPASYDEIISFFKGSEAQLFFEKMRAGLLKVSYKPQQVDLIAKEFKGSVRQLLSQTDEKGQLADISIELDLVRFLDSDISQLSGGELQRVAIAACVLKKANFYIFDEPTSYLDIRQRLRVSKFIRSLAAHDTAVMVIEHDLIILDCMTDLVHLMYGKPACYGIVSHPKSAKVGINAYLEGFLRDENLRFRPNAIQFEVRPPAKISETPVLVSWGGLKKGLGRFSLQSDIGEIRKKQVLGVLGENGIGKTTFVKILAGVIKPDEGNIDCSIRVSYKPQYLDSSATESVAFVLQLALEKFDAQLIKPLELHNLLDRRVCDLSGGELQKVAITYCLSQDADLYLLDEPSAYLDVEQRLVVSKVIGDLMFSKGTSALIVDHDLLFVDYLSQGLIVFEGSSAIHGFVKGPFNMEDGMNLFLKDLGLTFRRDPESHRPRANKLGSQMDVQQREEGRLYYTS